VYASVPCSHSALHSSSSHAVLAVFAHDFVFPFSFGPIEYPTSSKPPSQESKQIAETLLPSNLPKNSVEVCSYLMFTTCLSSYCWLLTFER
jgi:hypothetical protein